MDDGFAETTAKKFHFFLNSYRYSFSEFSKTVEALSKNGIAAGPQNETEKSYYEFSKTPYKARSFILCRDLQTSVCVRFRSVDFSMLTRVCSFIVYRPDAELCNVSDKKVA